MKLTVFNGSTRGRKSNTKILTDWFIEGFNSEKVNDIGYFFIKDQKNLSEMIEKFRVAKTVLIAFPLYTDAMPGIVKNFIDLTEPLRGKMDGTKIFYMVHSGFPEAVHSRGVEKYLERLTEILGAEYLGTIVKPGSEGIKMMPPFMTKKTSETLKKVGTNFAKTGKLDHLLLKKLAGKERMGAVSRTIYRLVSLTGLTNFYWNGMLKKNSAWRERFNTPYSDN